MKRNHSGKTEGSHVWVGWSPDRLGKHTIYAQVLERRNDPVKGNNHDTFEINAAPCTAENTRLVSPKDDTKVKRPKVRLKWKGGNCASHYELQVRRLTRAGDLVVGEQPLTQPRFKATLAEGQYRWRVRACNASSCGEWTKERTFTVAPTARKSAKQGQAGKKQ